MRYYTTSICSVLFLAMGCTDRLPLPELPPLPYTGTDTTIDGDTLSDTSSSGTSSTGDLGSVDPDSTGGLLSSTGLVTDSGDSDGVVCAINEVNERCYCDGVLSPPASCGCESGPDGCFCMGVGFSQQTCSPAVCWLDEDLACLCDGVLSPVGFCCGLWIDQCLCSTEQGPLPVSPVDFCDCAVVDGGVCQCYNQEFPDYTCAFPCDNVGDVCLCGEDVAAPREMCAD